MSLHGVKTQKNIIIFTAMKTSNFTQQEKVLNLKIYETMETPEPSIHENNISR
jgi:hypothetical protein